MRRSGRRTALNFSDVERLELIEFALYGLKFRIF